MDQPVKKHRSQFEQHPRVQYVEKSQGRTHQSFTKQCDINVIMAKYAQTGILPQGPVGQYGDFSNPIDYQDACNLVLKAEAQFKSLDAKVRARFANDPRKFLEFTSDASNAEEMVRLGLMKPEAVKRVTEAKAAAAEKKAKKEEPKS